MLSICYGICRVGCQDMIPSVSCKCPNCGREITITGIKLIFDNPEPQPQKPLASKVKEYVGWSAADKPTIRVDNSGDPNEDVGKMVKDIVDKTPRIQEDPNPENLKIKEYKEETHKTEPPTIDESHTTAVTKVEPVAKESPVAKEGEVVTLLKKLIPLLDEKIYPELRTFVDSLVIEDKEKKKKEEIKKRFTAW